MNIPGTKLVEDALRALPSHARLEGENRELRAENEKLKAEIVILKAQLAALQPVADIEVEAAKILRILFERNALIGLPEIAQLFEGKESVAKYHLEKLSEIDFVKDVTGADLYELRPKGRDFFVKNGMA